MPKHPWKGIYNIPEEVEVEDACFECRYDSDGYLVEVALPVNVGYDLPSPPTRYTGPMPLDKNTYPIASSYVARPERVKPVPEKVVYYPYKWYQRSFRPESTEKLNWVGGTEGSGMYNEREE